MAKDYLETVDEAESRKKIVVVGAGMSGLYVAQALRKRKDVIVTLISDKEEFVFLPRLTEYFARSTPQNRIVVPLNQAWKDERITDRVTLVNPDEKHVILASGKQVPYDILVLSVGCQTNFFGTPGSQYSFPFYSKMDADNLREHVERLLEADEQQGTWVFTIVGGGPTGVETAYVLNKMAKAKRAKARVMIVERGPQLLRMLPEALAKAATEALEKSGVEIILNTGVSSISPMNVEFQKADGEKNMTPCYTTVWAAGSKPVSVAITGLQPTQHGEIPVDSALSVRADHSIFCLGDCAGSGVPKTAQSAVQQAEQTVANITAVLTGKMPSAVTIKEKGVIIALEENTTGLFFGKLVKGFFARETRDVYYRTTLRNYTG